MAPTISVQGLCGSDISDFAGISTSSLKRLLRRTHRLTGAVLRKTIATGLPHLDAMDVKVHRRCMSLELLHIHINSLNDFNISKPFLC